MRPKNQTNRPLFRPLPFGMGDCVQPRRRPFYKESMPPCLPWLSRCLEGRGRSRQSPQALDVKFQQVVVHSVENWEADVAKQKQPQETEWTITIMRD